MNILDWSKCEREFIRNVEIDKERIESIKEKAIQRLNLIETIELNDKTMSFIVEGYYEVIKELLVAYLLANGLRSKNHQCLISYLYKEHPEMEHDVMLISQMSYYRNRLDYYGESVPTTFFDKNKNDIKLIIKKLNKLI